MNIRRVLSILACILLIALVAAFALMHWDQWEDHIYVPPETMESVLDNGSPMPLFSLEKGGGYGRIEDTATVTWTVYADGTADAEKLGRRTSKVQFSEEDFDTLCSMITLKKLRSLRAIEDWEVMDGCNQSIILYDKNGDFLMSRGGHVPFKGEFTDLYYQVCEVMVEYIPL